MQRAVSADRLSEYRIRPAVVEQNSTSPSEPSHVGSKHKPPRPAPPLPLRSPKTMLTTVPHRAEKSDRHASCSPKQRGEKDQGRYADSQLQNRPPVAYPRRSASLRRPTLPIPHPALPGSDAQSCPSPSMKAPASPQEGRGHRQQQQLQPAMAASAPSTLYMPGKSSTMPRTASRSEKSLQCDRDPVNSSKPESTVAQSGSPGLMITDLKTDHCEDVDEFVVPPAPQRPPRRKKGSGAQQGTQKQASPTTSLKTGDCLNQSSSTGSHSNENTPNDPLPVPKPRHTRKSKNTSTTTLPPISTTTATTVGFKSPENSHQPAKQTPVPPPKTYKEKPVRPPPPRIPTRKDRPPLPVPMETKASVSRPLLSSPACANGSTTLCKIVTADMPGQLASSPTRAAVTTNLVNTDVTRQPISPEPDKDPDYAYVDIHKTRKLLKARGHKNPLLGDSSDSDEDVENVANSGFYMPLERSTLLMDSEYAQVTIDSRPQKPADGGLEDHSIPDASSGVYSSITTTTMVTKRASTHPSPSELKNRTVSGRAWSKS